MSDKHIRLEDATVPMMRQVNAIDRKAKEGNATICDAIASGTILAVKAFLERLEPANVIPVPDGGVGEISDGYHTFNGLYHQRAVLFAALVKAHRVRAWKSRRHSDGEPCFGGGWFIVGIDTPEGSYTYHYEDKYWDMFECQVLEVGLPWDGHTEEDVTRLLSLEEGT